VAGDPVSLDELRAMADTGESWVLIDGTGKLMGRFVIESIDETRTVFFADGAARQIEFSLTLARVDDDDFIEETDDEIIIEEDAGDDPFEFDGPDDDA
jgi:phage protein U